MAKVITNEVILLPRPMIIEIGFERARHVRIADESGLTPVAFGHSLVPPGGGAGNVDAPLPHVRTPAVQGRPDGNRALRVRLGLVLTRLHGPQDRGTARLSLPSPCPGRPTGSTNA